MASSGNFATWNPLANTQAGASYAGAVYSQGNTRFRGNTGGTATTLLTHGLPSGKWYIEFFVDGSPASGFPMIGIVANGDNSTTLQNTSNAPALTITSDIQLVNGEKRVFGSTSGTSYGSGFSDEDICQIAVDIDNGKIWWGKNNTWFNSGDPAAGSNAGDTFTALTEMMVFVGSYEGASYMICNAGQDDTFGGEITGAGNADGNGFGAFKYSPPSGFLAICSANLPIDSGIDPAQTDDDPPSKLFGLLSYTGNGGANSVTGLGFKPDLVWGLNRSASQGKRVLDSSRGGNNYVFLDAADAQTAGAGAGDTVEFLDDGIKWNNTNGNNDNTVTYAAACWRANGGTTASNTSGTITTTVQADPPQSFSIVTYSGTGSNATIGHGLSAAPDCIFWKNLSQNDSWAVYNSGGLLGNNKLIRVDQNLGSSVSGTAYMQATDPTSTVISIGDEHKLNASGENYVAYCWRNTEGFQKFGTFKGTGNTDGAYVYTGFRPSVVLVAPLKFSGSPHWGFHNIISNSNGASIDTLIDLDDTYAEYSSTGRRLEMLANGFKARTSDSAMNHSTGMGYFAWGDVPFKYNNNGR